MHRIRSMFNARSSVYRVHQRGSDKADKRETALLCLSCSLLRRAHRSFRMKIRNRVTIEGEKEREGSLFSRGRSNLGRAKQSRPRNRGRGVGGVRKGRDDATGREIFGGGRGSSMVGVGVWVGVAGSIQGGFVAASTKAQRLLLLFAPVSALFSFFLGKLTSLRIFLACNESNGLCKEFYIEVGTDDFG